MTEKSPFRSQDGAGGAGYQPQNSPTDASPTRRSELGAAFDRALVFHQTGRLSEAEQMYRQVLNDQPNHFDALHFLGVIHHQRGNHVEAVRHIDAALTINPMLASAYNNRGNALGELMRFDEALEAFLNRGIALEQLKRFEEAVANYNQAIAANPREADIFYKRGNARQSG